MKAILGIGLVQVGYGAAGAIAGFLFGSLCAAIAGFIYLVAALKIQPTGKILRPAFHLASAMFGALLGMALLLNLDLVALKLFSQGNRAAVGWYQAGTILANTPYYLLTATIPILFTQIARHQVIGKSVNAVADTLRLALIVLLPIEGVLAGFPHFFLHLLFPAPYLAGAPTLRLLALGNAAIILVAVFSTAFQASGNPGFPGKVLLSITLLESLVLRFVVPRWHGVGASTTFLTATSIALLILGWSYLTHLDQDAVRQALTWMKKYLVALLAGATGAAVMVSLGRADWLAVGWGGVVYLVVIAWLKLFSISGLITRPIGYQNGSTSSFGERSEIE
jgi:O-antigen/teichoic acid export membrane protein